MSFTSPLPLVDALDAAEEAAVTAAFVHAARHTATALNGTPDGRSFSEWIRRQREHVIGLAEPAAAADALPAERLRCWLLVRPFDDDPRCRRLTVRLERLLLADAPELFQAAEPWLRRGFAPQTAVVHAVAAGQAVDTPSAVAWVNDRREQLMTFMETTGVSDERRAVEAFFDLRARHDFHFRILLGVTTEHDVTRLDDSDVLLACMVGAVWSGLEFQNSGLARSLIAFTQHHSDDSTSSGDTAQTVQHLLAELKLSDATTSTRERP